MSFPDWAVTVIGMLLVVLVLIQAATMLRRRRPQGGMTKTDYGQIAGSSASDGLIVQDRAARILWVNPAYCKMMGWKAEEILGLNPMSFAMPPESELTAQDIADFRYDESNHVYQKLNVGKLSLFENVRKNGERFWNQISHSHHVDDRGQTLVVLVCRDVTDQIAKEDRLRETTEKLEYGATHDALTGAANRTKLASFVENALTGARHRGGCVGLLHIDLDQFKDINDVHGHLAGDAVLRHVTAQAGAVLRKSDLFARIGGDEFVAVLPRVDTDAELKAVAVDLRQALQRPLVFDGLTLKIDASIGATLSKDGHDTLDDLLRDTDFALYEVKRAGRGAVKLFDTKVAARRKRQTRRTNELRDALEQGEIKHFFQPYGEIVTGAPVGFEALARWVRRDGEVLLPENFLSVAAENNLLKDIDHLGFRAANRLSEALRGAGIGHLAVHVNCSVGTLCDPEFRPLLRQDIALRGLEPKNLTIEIEGSDGPGGGFDIALRDQCLTDLHADGFGIYIDNFAAGFQGMRALKQLPVTGYKIDTDVVKSILEDPVNREIAELNLRLTEGLKLRAVFEGVEDAGAAAELARLGAQYLQGHLLSAAMPAEQVLAWCTRQKTTEWPVVSAIAPADAPRYLRANS